MNKKIIKKTRMIFPIMIVFLALYLVATPEKIADKTFLFRNQAPLADSETKEKLLVSKDKPSEKYVSNQIVIKLRKKSANVLSAAKPEPTSTGLSSLDSLNKKFSVTAMERVGQKDINLKQTYKITFKYENTKEVVKAYRENENVEWSELNYMARASVTNPNDPKFLDGTQWGLNQVGDHDVDAPEGWDQETGDSGTVIAVIDSGVDLDHPDLAANIWNNAGESGGGKENNDIDDDGNGYTDDYQGWDWVTSYNNAPEDNDPTPEPDGINNDGWYGVDDGVEHGTHVAGITAAATNNGTGIAGVCWTCKIMALRILDDEGWGSYADIISAIEYAAANGADVINMSLGGGYSNMLDDAIEYAYKNNVVVVSAAGNEATNLRYDLRSPVCNDGNQNMIIGVAATTSTDTLAAYSNYGTYYTDVSAPGSSIYSSLYTNDPGHGFVTDYGYMSGTSMASPHVAGLAGLVKSQNPTWSAAEVRDRVINLTDNLDSLNPSYNQRMGSGRINLNRALNSANGFYPSGTPVKVAGQTYIWIILNGQKRLISSTVFREFYFDNIYDIVYVSSGEINKYPYGPEARFPDGTLVGAQRSGRVYVLDERQIRKIPDWNTFYDLDYRTAYIRWSNYEYTNYIVGSDIDSSSHPSGTVVTSDGGTNYYVIDTYRRNHITAPTFVSYYTYANHTCGISGGEMATYTDGTDVRYPGGILLGDNGSGDIYYIEYNKKRIFDNVAEVTSMGYREDNIRWRTGEAVNYTDGQAMGF